MAGHQRHGVAVTSFTERPGSVPYFSDIGEDHAAMNVPKSLAAIAALCISMAAAPAWAADPFTVRDIRLEGLQRVEPGTVFSTLGIKAGDDYSDERGSAAIRALFELGLFKDVRIDVDGNVLVVIVEERPTVADVDFVGTKEFEKAALQKALREIGLAEGRRSTAPNPCRHSAGWWCRRPGGRPRR